MRFISTPRLLVLTGLAACSLCAQSPQDHPPNPSSSLSPKDAAVERMLSERNSLDKLNAAIEAARKLGVSEQAIFESRFLFYVDQRDDKQLAALVPEALKRRETFRLEDSEIFAQTDDWLSAVEYLQALDANLRNDRNAFKKHITEAFWLSPRQSAAYTQTIERFRLEEAMKTLTLDLDTSLTALADQKKISLQSLLQDHKALVLHFWSPFNRECEEQMPDFKAVASLLAKNQIAVASISAESDPDSIKEALTLIRELGSPPPGQWLHDSPDLPLFRTLRIQDLPNMVLISPNGKILFNGHPSDEALWKQLHTLSPELQRPKLPTSPE